MLKTVGLTCALLLSVSTFAAAQTATSTVPAVTSARAQGTADDFAKRLQNEGFTNVRDVNMTDRGFTAMASKDGKDVQVELTENNDIHVIR